MFTRQYFEDDDMTSPLTCAWDFVLQQEKKKIPTGNETAALTLNVKQAFSFSLRVC